MSGDMFIALTGAASYVQHFQNIRRSPNCRWVLSPSEGPGSAFLKLQVSTANGCGVAAGSELCVNYGTHFDVSKKYGCDSPVSKKLKAGPCGPEALSCKAIAQQIQIRYRTLQSLY